MPAPIIPIIIATVASAAVSGSIIYFFVSNHSNKEREKYMIVVNEVLELFQKKVEKIKNSIKLKEEKIGELENSNKKSQFEIDALRKEIENLRINLVETETEKIRLAEELANWKEIHREVSDQFSVTLIPATTGLIVASDIFRQSKYKPKRVFEFLQNKKIEVQTEIANLPF